MNDREHLEDIRRQYWQGEISYVEAHDKAKPFIESVNEKGRAIAKKHSIRYRNISFTGFLR